MVSHVAKLLMMIALVTLAGCGQKANHFTHDITPPPSPWVGVPINDSDNKYSFAIFSDLNGGEREGVFNVGAAQLDLFKPDFIMSIGDLIDGGTEDKAQLKKEWDSFDARAVKAGAPIFRVGGNHDLTNVKMREVWATRYGPRYYHFIYRDALFLILDSEDFTEERMQEVYHARAEAIRLWDGPNPALGDKSAYMKMDERKFGEIGSEQSAYFERVLAANPDVKWTFLFMHKPTWLREDSRGLARVEAALKGRSYTVFNGHYHSFKYEVRHDMDYIMLATTGGSQGAEDVNAFDHLTLITMDADAAAPSIAHLKMEGILDKAGKIPIGGNKLCFQKSKCGTIK